jgi:SsrA-binding protein
MPTYAKNKKARFDYEILQNVEAGLVLSGQEVKSVRAGQMNLSGAFVSFMKDEAYLTNAHIPKYKYAGSVEGYDPDRSRKLLLKTKEIAYLQGKKQEKGLTIVPLSVYTSGRHIKLDIGVARGKKQFDKKRVKKDRDIEREARRAIKDL